LLPQHLLRNAEPPEEPGQDLKTLPAAAFTRSKPLDTPDRDTLQATPPTFPPGNKKGPDGPFLLHARSAQPSTVAMRSRLVLPGMPNGMPAVIAIMSPGLAKPSSCVTLIATATMSVTELTSSTTLACTPQTKAMRRAVSSFGVMHTIGAVGRSRAARIDVVPEVV